MRGSIRISKISREVLDRVAANGMTKQCVKSFLFGNPADRFHQAFRDAPVPQIKSIEDAVLKSGRAAFLTAFLTEFLREGHCGIAEIWSGRRRTGKAQLEELVVRLVQRIVFHFPMVGKAPRRSSVIQVRSLTAVIFVSFLLSSSW